MLSNEKAIDAKANLSAFSGYLENGLQWVKKNFPGQVKFVQDNKDKTYDEIVELTDNIFAAKA